MSARIVTDIIHPTNEAGRIMADRRVEIEFISGGLKPFKVQSYIGADTYCRAEYSDTIRDAVKESDRQCRLLREVAVCG